MKNSPKIAILASGNASNLNTINNSIKLKELNLDIVLLISNNSNAPALQNAQNLNIDTKVINTKNHNNPSQEIYNELVKYDCKFVLLSGYMKKIDKIISDNFIVINTHPALLPAYGGKGMYGRYVHEAVIKNNEKYSGVTVHYVNENYDEGEILYQEKISLSGDETVDSLEYKIKKLEKDIIIKALKLCLK